MTTAKKTVQTKKKLGAPTLYTDELADKIIGLISQGFSEREISKKQGMPSLRTIQNWKDKYPDFLQRSARAREDSAALYDDKRRQTNEWLRNLMEQHAKSGKPIPKGVVEAARAVMQEDARSAANRNDALFGDRKTVAIDAAKDTGEGLAAVYEKIRQGLKQPNTE